MTLLEKERILLQQWRALPDDKQQEAIDFVEFLSRKAAGKRPLKSSRGLWTDLNVTITADDIAEARREMWGNFPRDIEL